LSITDQVECGIVDVSDAVAMIQLRVPEVPLEYDQQLQLLQLVNLSRDEQPRPLMEMVTLNA
jgi:hypothetical protein